MQINDVRTKYIEFFIKRGHIQIPSASLVPQNDPTTLFVGSGMQPLVPYLLGEPHPKGNRLVNSQKSFRAEDIEEVGDNRHTTFFEMLGNWSLGDYFKHEQLRWVFTFLTEEIGIDPNKLYVTAFIGDKVNNVPQDTEAVALWKELFAEKGITAESKEIGSEQDGYEKGMGNARIFYYEAKKNWWSRSGVPEKMPAGEPGGPDSEIFYDFGSTSSPQAVHHDEKFGKYCHPNCDCGRFMEIGNSVFMQYIKKEDDTFVLLPQQNVDFGGGLERITAASNDNADVFATDVFADIIDLLSHFSGKDYADTQWKRSFRIVADHMRAATFMLADGVRPSNTDRGYILRRLIRRAAQHAQKLGIAQDQGRESMLNRCAVIIIEKYKQAYTELASEEMYEEVTSEIWKEEKQFGHTLETGMKELEAIIRGLTSESEVKPRITGEQAFILFTTYGFPFEMTQEIAQERGIAVDENTFKELMQKHKDLSRSGSEQKFKGGLADTSEQTTRLHTAHHLLLRALQMVLGDTVHQRGSNITAERLRIDFSYGAKMTPEQIKQVEGIVNAQITAALPVERVTIARDEAEKIGAEHEFGAKYPDVVSVYLIGPAVSDDVVVRAQGAFSKEFCGGPHVQNTADLGGTFKILKDEAVASGIRRIKAVIV